MSSILKITHMKTFNKILFYNSIKNNMSTLNKIKINRSMINYIVNSKNFSSSINIQNKLENLVEIEDSAVKVSKIL
jgi:hypothetical protein